MIAVARYIEDQLEGREERTLFAFWKEYGFDEIHALNLAKNHTVSVHQAFRLKEVGCPLAWAYEILS